MNDFLKQHDTIGSALKASKAAITGNGDYRALKFTIRGNQPVKKGSPHRFCCDQFVILYLQVAELELLNQDVNGKYFTPLASPNNLYSWISITNPNRDLIRQLLNDQDHPWVFGNKPAIKAYTKQFGPDFSQRKTKHATIGRDIALMIVLAKPNFVTELKYFYHSKVALNAKDCSPSTLIQHFTDDDGGSGFGLVGIVIKLSLAKNFPDHKIIEHDMIEKSITKKQPVEMNCQGDRFYTRAIQTLLFPSQDQANLTPRRRMKPIRATTPYFTLLQSTLTTPPTTK